MCFFENGTSYSNINKYNKRYKKQKINDKIKCDGNIYSGQEGVTEGITGYYKKNCMPQVKMHRLMMMNVMITALDSQ